GKVFPALYKRHEKFWMCSSKKCGKIYWAGSHWEKIRELAERVSKRAKRAERGPAGGRKKRF
ncbi:MAG: hypothetical protein NTY90_00770, partial [Candidatus Micrarchaeota archaeon]|nr:hypothetical protein [Candidatus Micrarchaeota archaeon]